MTPHHHAGEPFEPLDETLRLVGTLPPPEGLTDRVKENLRTARRSAGLISWPRVAAPARWMHSPVLRGAAAAAIVGVVAGGGWQIYSRVLPAPSAQVISPARGNSGAFSNANAMRTPDTLTRPVVPPPPPKASGGANAKQPQGASKQAKAVAKKKPADLPR